MLHVILYFHFSFNMFCIYTVYVCLSNMFVFIFVCGNTLYIMHYKSSFHILVMLCKASRNALYDLTNNVNGYNHLRIPIHN